MYDEFMLDGERNDHLINEETYGEEEEQIGMMKGSWHSSRPEQGYKEFMLNGFETAGRNLHKCF